MSQQSIKEKRIFKQDYIDLELLYSILSKDKFKIFLFFTFLVIGSTIFHSPLIISKVELRFKLHNDKSDIIAAPLREKVRQELKHISKTYHYSKTSHEYGARIKKIYLDQDGNKIILFMETLSPIYIRSLAGAIISDIGRRTTPAIESYKIHHQNLSRENQRKLDKPLELINVQTQTIYGQARNMERGFLTTILILLFGGVSILCFYLIRIYRKEKNENT